MLSARRRFANEQLREQWGELRSHRPVWWTLALFFTAYVLAGGLGQGLALIPGVSITFWPPAGIFLAALLLSERRSWPWWILVGGAAELTCNAVWFHNPIWLAVLYFGANATEALTAAWLIQRFSRTPFRLEALNEVASLVLFGGILAPVVGATLIAALDATTGRHPFGTAWPLAWLGDGTGLLVSTPITLMLVRAWRERERIEPQKFLEAVTIGVLLIIVMALCSRGYLPTVYVALPLMLWAAVRFQLHGAPAAVALVTLLTASLTMQGRGEFAGQPEALHAKIVMLQTFLGIAAGSTLLVGALSWHRNEALKQLREINEHLEARVAERTATLQATTDRLELALEASRAGIWEADPTAGEFYASERALALHGQAMNTRINHATAMAVIHPDDRQMVEAALQHTLTTGATYRVEFRAPQPDGSIRWLLSQAELRLETGKQRLIGLVQDITERKVAEARLHESEHRLRLAMAATATGMWDWDLATGAVTWSPECYPIHGLSQGEFGGTGAAFNELVHPDDRKRVWASVRAATNQQTVYECEFRLVHPSGEMRWVSNLGRALYDEQGRPIRMIGTINDITERKKVEAALQASEQRYRRLHESMRDAFVVVDMEGKIQDCNAAYCDLLGYSRDELARLTYVDVTPAKWHEFEAQVVAEEILPRGSSGVYEKEYRRKDGGIIPVELRTFLLRDEKGQPHQMWAIVRDIGQRKQSEAMLRASEVRMRAVVDNAIDGVVVIDERGIVDLFSSSAEKLFGYRSEEVIGRNVKMLMPEPYRTEHDDYIANYVRTGMKRAIGCGREVAGRRKDSSTFAMELGVSEFRLGERRYFTGVVRDISARKKVEEELNVLRKRLEAAIDASQVVLFNQDRELRYTWIHNPALGYAAEEVVGKRDTDLFQRAEDAARTEAIKRSVVESGIARREEVCVVQDGESRYFDLVVQPDRDVNGAIAGVNCAAVDVTVRRQVEEILQESETRFRNMANMAPGMLWVTDEQHQCTFISRGWREFTGQTEEHGLGMGWSEPIHPDDRTRAAESFLAAAARREPFSLDYRLRRADGEYRWVIDTGRPRYDERRVFLGYIGSVIDVHERKQIEGALNIAGESFRQLVEQSPFGVYAVDADFRLAMVSAGAQKVFQNVRPLLGRDFDEVLRILWPEPFVSETLDRFRHTLATGEPYDAPSTVEQRADIGDTEAYDWKIERVILPDGRPGVVCHFYDLSERQRYEALLQDTDRKKDEFLATLAHELRNPLAPIRNGLQLMKLAGDDREVVEDSLRMMERQMEQMTRLIDDLMDVSRINRGKIELRCERVELAEVVRGAVETSRPLIEECDHNLVVSLPPRPVVLHGDATRLAQVFANLLNNAAKYMERGGRIDLVAEAQGGEAVVSVRDTGIGISAEELPTIFEMFTQVEAGLARSRGGLGLGLSLVKKLIEMHDGSIEAHSDGPGMGSEFKVHLPVLHGPVEANEPMVDRQKTGAKSNLRVLVVDDNLDAAKTTGMLLKVMGNSVQLAHDGEAAVASAEEFQPHVVLCDIGLPKLNGYEVCRRIRAEAWGEPMLLIAITGWGQDNDRQTAEAAGFDHHLVKPVEPRTLMKMLAELESTKLRTSPAGSWE